MSAPFSESTASVPARSKSKPKAAAPAAAAAAAVLLVTSLVGPGWLYVPANPAAQVPAMTLSFGDLHDLTAGGAVPTNGLQDAYFSWLAWILVAAVSVLAVALAVAPRRSLAWLVVVASVVGLVVTTLALKGPLSWGDFLDQAKNLRIGGYLVIIGFIGTLVLAAISLRRRLEL